MKKLLKHICKRMIERTYFLYLNGDINVDEAEKTFLLAHNICQVGAR